MLIKGEEDAVVFLRGFICERFIGLPRSPDQSWDLILVKKGNSLFRPSRGIYHWRSKITALRQRRENLGIRDDEMLVKLTAFLSLRFTWPSAEKKDLLSLRPPDRKRAIKGGCGVTRWHRISTVSADAPSVSTPTAMNERDLHLCVTKLKGKGSFPIHRNRG